MFGLVILQITLTTDKHVRIVMNSSAEPKLFLMNEGDELFFHFGFPSPSAEVHYHLPKITQIVLPPEIKFALVPISLKLHVDETDTMSCEWHKNHKSQKGILVPLWYSNIRNE